MRSSATKALDFADARRRLLALREELMRRQRANLADENELLSSAEPDVPDVAANRSAAALLDRLSDAELLQISRITEALERIDQGSYGRCTVCGGSIAKARLAVMPEADRCEYCHNSH